MDATSDAHLLPIITHCLEQLSLSLHLKYQHASLFDAATNFFLASSPQFCIHFCLMQQQNFLAIVTTVFTSFSFSLLSRSTCNFSLMQNLCRLSQLLIFICVLSFQSPIVIKMSKDIFFRGFYPAALQMFLEVSIGFAV
jgi:hypothetical protein